MKNLSGALVLMVLLQFSCAPNRDMRTTDTSAGNTNEPVVIVEERTVDPNATVDGTDISRTGTDNTMLADDSDIMVYFDEAATADLNRYRTYYWVTPIQGMGDKSASNDPMYQDAIQQAVTSELQKKGYQMMQNNPDVLVNYYVFKEPTRLTGTNNSDFDEFQYNPNDIRRAGDTRTYDLDAGTVLLQMVDRQSGKLVWQGYATGLTDGDITTLDDTKVKDAIMKIFDKYDYQAMGMGNR